MLRLAISGADRDALITVFSCLSRPPHPAIHRAKRLAYQWIASEIRAGLDVYGVGGLQYEVARCLPGCVTPCIADAADVQEKRCDTCARNQRRRKDEGPW